MKLLDHLQTMSHDERLMFLGRLQGMSLAMRIISNRAHDSRIRHQEAMEKRTGESCIIEAQEAETLAAIIRLVQVGIGNGSQPFPELSAEELDEINRIY